MSLSNTIIFGDKQAVAQQLAHCGDLDYVDEFGYTPLIQAAIVNNVDIARMIIKKSVDINMPDLTGRTALHWAIDNSNIELCELLLENGANPNAYTLASQPVLIKPMLRGETAIKELLCRHGADLTFAQDYINSKLLGHRFELVGYVDIIDSDGRFTELSYEGFILEFTLDIIQESLSQFINNFAARHLESQFSYIHHVMSALQGARDLMKYQQYLTDVDMNVSGINKILRQDPLIIPVVQEGHAITLVRYRNLLAICDRSEKEDSRKRNVTIYYMNRAVRLNHALLKNIMYSRKSLEYVEKTLITELALQPMSSLNIPTQVVGNCSWANVEACMPTLITMMDLDNAKEAGQSKRSRKLAMSMYQEWCTWDKDRAMQFCIQSFAGASAARKASKATILSAILFQSCSATNPNDIRRAGEIIPLLRTHGYEYVLESYIKTYLHNHKSEQGDNLRQLLQYCDDVDDFEQVG